MRPRDIQRTRPRTPDHLHAWVRAFTGVSIARESVCRGHSAPFDMFSQAVLERPDVALWHGPRGSGKSFLSAIDTHIQSRFNPGHKTRVLGGSKAQSAQIYEALQQVVFDARGVVRSERDTIDEFLVETARYANGSEVKILAASPKSVRGPHVPSLKFDEVDEIDNRLREDAMGMVMELKGQRPAVLMTSTWHKPGGPMSGLIERGRAGAFPTHTYCVFEVLQRCPEETSGPELENCPLCPLQQWCHSDRDSHPSGLPKAKRSNGHYTIGSLIQKAKTVGERVFASDYLCDGPQVEGLWFARFSERWNVSETAEFNPELPVHISVDCGVHTGAVVGQFVQPMRTLDSIEARRSGGYPGDRVPDGPPSLHVFAEYYSYDAGADAAAREILRVLEERCNGRQEEVSMDSAGGDRNPMGRTVQAEYEVAGLKGRTGIRHWPKYPGSVLDSLQLTEAFVRSATGEVRLLIHPRCKRTIQAFQNYRRVEVEGQFIDKPEDPQHPHEDLIDPVRGMLMLKYPNRNRPPTEYHAARPASGVF